jgi:hypothetical protein
VQTLKKKKKEKKEKEKEKKGEDWSGDWGVERQRRGFSLFFMLI